MFRSAESSVTAAAFQPSPVESVQRAGPARSKTRATEQRPVTEDAIARLVDAFYAKVREDPRLGPIFAGAIGDDGWADHLATLRDFWSSVVLKTGRYGGKPHLVHRDLDLCPEHFERWLALFEVTAREVCPGEAAGFFVDRAHRIADSLMIGLNIGPKAVTLPSLSGAPA
jgi:hemoglobin